MEDQYYDIQRRTEIKDTARELRRKYLRYKAAELVYSIQHKKFLELADRAGAIYRIDGYVLINRDMMEDIIVKKCEIQGVAVHVIKSPVYNQFTLLKIKLFAY